MGWTHDFINGSYYEDDWTGERMSTHEYYERQRRRENLRKGQHYILIETCEGQIRGKKTYCDIRKWNYYADQEEAPKDIVILSEKECIKNEKRNSYYRKYKGDHYLSVEVDSNVKLKVDKVEEIQGFFICTTKGKGTLYTKEEFQEKILP